MPNLEKHHLRQRAPEGDLPGPGACRVAGFEADTFSEQALGAVALVSIAEVRRLTGLTRKALRVYEALGLVLPAARTGSGYRLYDHQGLRRLRLVARARALGLTLAEVAEFLDAADGCCGERQRQLGAILERKLAETVRLLEELRARREELRQVAADLPGIEAGESSRRHRSCARQEVAVS